MDAPQPADLARQAEAAGDLDAAIDIWRTLYTEQSEVRWALRLAVALGKAGREEDATALFAKAADAAEAKGDDIAALVAALAGDLPDLAQRFAGKDVPLLRWLDEDDFNALLPHLSRQALAPGEVLIREGAAADALFIIAEGALTVVREDEKAGELSLGILAPGSIAGEMSLVLDRPRTASVRAIDECETLRVELEGIRTAAQETPSLGDALEKFTERRLLNAVVGSSPLLRGVAPAQRDKLIPEFASVEVPAGTTLVTQDEPGDGIYVVVSGAAKVVRVEDDEPVELARLGPGQVFGEISLLSDGPATATVTTTEDTVLKHLDAAAFAALCTAHPDVRAQLARLGNDRIVEIRFIFEDDEFIEAAD